ncbi:DUF1990 family protein [Ilumatobacter sp.]|uniref:DUF1990 family protein n=1 Tax=Ilumatobacter sp. TaxID=1967498 RepID=UPI003B5155AF
MSGRSNDGAGIYSAARNGVRAAWTLPVFIARHAWRTRDVERDETETAALSVDPPEHQHHERLQPRSRGVGPIVMRTYSVEIADPVVEPDRLMHEFRIDPNHFVSNLAAAFVRDDRPVRNMRAGDEVVVELPGPWNGPCTVEVVEDTRVLMSTLAGHMEAGHIAFEVTDADEVGTYTFRVRSWARAGDAGFASLHLVVPIGKELQTAMWCAMCERAVRISGGRRVGPIRASTETLAGSDTGGGDR